MEPERPPDLTPDSRAAERASSVVVSFGAGGDCSFGSQAEAQAARPWSGAHHLKVRHLAPNEPLKAVLSEKLSYSLIPLAAPVSGSERPTLSVVWGETRRRITSHRPSKCLVYE